jgi:hypothetical protein
MVEMSVNKFYKVVVIAASCLATSAHAGCTGFRAYNSALQFFPNQVYQQVSFNSIVYDTSGGYNAANSSWTPIPIGGQPAIVDLGAQIWMTGGAGTPWNPGNPDFDAKYYKNWSGGAAPAGVGPGPNLGLLGTASILAIIEDLAQPGDVYSLFLYATASPDGNVPFQSSLGPGTVQVDNNPQHVFLYGRTCQ